MPVRLLVLAVALMTTRVALAGIADALLSPDPEATVFGGSRVPPALTDTPRADFPTSLRWCGEGRVSAETLTEAPLRVWRDGRRTARLDTRATTLRLAAPIVREGERGWFIGWRTRFIDTSGHYGDPGDEIVIDGHSSECAIGVAWAIGGGWTFGASVTDYDMRLDGSGPGLDDWQRRRPGNGWASFDFDSSAYTLAVERRRRSHIWGVQHSRRPVDAFLQLPKRRDLYMGAYDGTLATWHAWYARERGPRRWFAWAATSSLDSGQDPLAAYPQLRGRIHTSFDALTVGVGTRRSSPDATTQLDLSYQRHDLAVDGWLDMGFMSGGLTGRCRLDAWADVDTLALRCGRRRYYGPWRAHYGLSAAYSSFDAYYHYVDSPGPFQPPDEEWRGHADNATAWTLALTAGGGYRTSDWELAATFTVLGAIVDADFVDLLTRPSSTPKSTSSQTLKPGYAMGLTWTWML